MAGCDNRGVVLRRLTLSLALVVVLAVVDPAGAQTPMATSVSPAPPAEPDSAAPDPREIARLRSEVEQLRSRVESRRGSVTDAAAEARRLDVLVVLLARERQLAEAEIRKASAEADSVAAEIEQATRARAHVVERLGKRLAALYRLGSGGLVRILLAPGPGDRLEAARTIAFLARRDQALLRELRERTDVLVRHTEELSRLRATVEQLARRRSSKEEELREARNHQSIVAGELRRAQNRDAQRLADLQERAGRLERLLDLIEKSKRAPSLPGENPHRFRGALAWPYDGSVLTAYGRRKHAKFDAWVMNNGIDIAAAPGHVVQAVYPGKVVYSRWLKGYGNLVILDHGSRFLTLYGKLGSISVEDGSEVKIGETVGSVGIPSDEEPAEVYFEIRDGGQAVDPVEWLRPSTRSAAK